MIVESAIKLHINRTLTSILMSPVAEFSYIVSTATTVIGIKWDGDSVYLIGSNHTGEEPHADGSDEDEEAISNQRATLAKYLRGNNSNKTTTAVFLKRISQLIWWEESFIMVVDSTMECMYFLSLDNPLLFENTRCDNDVGAGGLIYTSNVCVDASGSHPFSYYVSYNSNIYTRKFSEGELGSYADTQNSLDIVGQMEDCRTNHTVTGVNSSWVGKFPQYAYHTDGFFTLWAGKLVFVHANGTADGVLVKGPSPHFTLLTGGTRAGEIIVLGEAEGAILKLVGRSQQELTRRLATTTTKLIRFSSGYECSGRLLSQHAVRSVDSCASICLVERSCVSFTYTRQPDISRCLLHDVIDRSLKISASSETSYCYILKNE